MSDILIKNENDLEIVLKSIFDETVYNATDKNSGLDEAKEKYKTLNSGTALDGKYDPYFKNLVEMVYNKRAKLKDNDYKIGEYLKYEFIDNLKNNYKNGIKNGLFSWETVNSVMPTIINEIIKRYKEKIKEKADENFRAIFITNI